MVQLTLLQSKRIDATLGAAVRIVMQALAHVDNSNSFFIPLWKHVRRRCKTSVERIRVMVDPTLSFFLANFSTTSVGITGGMEVGPRSDGRVEKFQGSG